MPPPVRIASLFLGVLCILGAKSLADPAPATGVSIHYQLPASGPLPRTYRVTLAIVDAKNPDWIISEFASGVVRTVTAENQGKFTEVWDGLDDNFMPVPPGAYGVKGIFMPAQTWPIDGQPHTIVPKLASMGGSWGQTPAQDTLPDKIDGDPVGAPFRDVDIAPNGMGVAYFQYLENDKNGFLVDFTKPIGYDQIITGYPSGSVGGGSSACTDGKQIWILCDVGHQFILHADGTPFGTQNTTGREKVFLPEGWVTGLTAWPDPQLGRSVVFVAERGAVISPVSRRERYTEDASNGVNKVVALDDKGAQQLAVWKVDHPLSVKARGGKLYVLHGSDGKYEVDSLPLDANWKTAQFSPCLTVPAGIVPFDVEIDSHARFYLSDSAANHVYQFDSGGKQLRVYGKLDIQKGGAYDPGSFMSPEKLACWTDSQGKDRLLIVEQGGPNRLSEWSGDDGSMIRQWVIPQLMANDGYAVDPRHPDQIYMPGQLHTLVRWTVNYTTGEWTPNAVWFNVGQPHGGDKTTGPEFPGYLSNPRLFYHGDDAYLAYREGYTIYHFEGEKCRLCSAILRQKTEGQPRAGLSTYRYYLWRDLNGDGQIQPNEYLPFETAVPTGVFRYFGETWFDDLSLVAIGGGTNDIWRLGPPTFDSRGTPIFDPNGWKKLLTDDVFVAKAAGAATATHGGNETKSQGYDCAWADVAPGDNGDVYVQARFGYGFSANAGAQAKLSRYVPDGKGGYTQRWRVGRMAIRGNARPGEIYGAIFPCSPINGLVGIIDSWRSGIELYTEGGLYVDTLFPDIRVMKRDDTGAYFQPGEYFSGYYYANRDNGKIYAALGKVMPKIYELQGWTQTENPVQPITNLDREITIAAPQISAPPEIALQVRGGAAAARVARFFPAPGGGPALDGSMDGWTACDPVKFSTGPQQTVEARCFYDPDHLYIRWHARLGHKFEPKPLEPAEHIFAHDRADDTLGLYLQGDPNAKPGGSTPSGRPGDVRFVFGLFQDKAAALKPAVLGMYPSWSGSGGHPVTYTISLSTHFANVALVPGVKSGFQVDRDGQGFTLAASIPRAAIPGAANLDGWHTEGNFDANLGGLDRFWWSNADGTASRDVFDEPTEARLYPGAWSPVQFLPIENLPIHSWMAIGPFAFPGIVNLDIRKDRYKIIKSFAAFAFPPDTTRDMAAVYDGDITRTRVAQRKLQWRDEEFGTGILDLKGPLGWKAVDDEGVAYFLTHIYTPEPAQVFLNFTEGHGQSSFSAQLNGKPLPRIKDRDYYHLDPTQPLSLQQGWNELLIRQDYIWGEIQIAATLTADPATLWKMKISGPPPPPNP